MGIFAALTAYMLFAAGYTIIHAAHSGSSELTLIIFSLIATYGCYVLSSLLALDPWHLITCMPQVSEHIRREGPLWRHRSC